MSGVEEGDHGGPLRRRAAKGLLWTGGQAVLVRALSLVSFIVLARVLTAEEYGVVTLANVFVLFFGVFAAAGVSPNLVQRSELTAIDEDSAFWGSLVSALLPAIVLAATADLIGAAFDEPELAPVLRVLSICFPLIALGTVPAALLSRALRFKLMANTTIAANAIATLVGVAAALAGFGVWALVSQTVLSIAVQVGANIVLCGYRPGRQVSVRTASELLVSGIPYAGATLAEMLNQRTGDFAAGAALTSAAVGVWGVANRIVTILFEAVALSARLVAFPLLSRVKDDSDALARAYLEMTRIAAVGSVPVFLMAAAVAPEMIPLVFGEKWESSVYIMQILCLSGPVTTVTLFNSATLQAAGKARTALHVTVAGAVLQCAGFVMVAANGLAWIAWTMVARAVLIAPFEFLLAARQTTLQPWKAPIAAFPSLLAGVTGFVAVSVSRPTITAGVGDLGALILPSFIGLAVYIATVAVIRVDDLRQALAFGRQALSRRA